MRRALMWCLVAVGMILAVVLDGQAQRPTVSQINSAPNAQSPAPEVPPGTLQGMVKCGNISLPGVTVTAQNTLTGKRYSTITGLNGAWSLTIAQNGRYVIRTQFAAFAPSVKEALLNAASRQVTVNFDLLLASRAAVQAQREEDGQSGLPTIRSLAQRGAQNMSLISTLSAGIEAQAGAQGVSGAALPAATNNTDFSGDSVAISGQSGTVSPMAGMDMDRMRDAMETMRAQGGNFGGGGLFGGGGPGGFGGPGGPGGGRGNFRGFNPGQPHGAIFWSGSNSALNAEPFSLRGQSQEQPASGTNRFGLTFMSAPYLPGLTKPSGKDSIFLTLSGQRSSSPSDQYATVPTDDEREGSAVDQAKALLCPKSQASALKCTPYIPYANLIGDTQNYHLLTTSQSNSTQAGVRYMRSLGKNATLTGNRRRTQNQGLRQSVNGNYNWSRSAQDDVNLLPRLGGKGSSNSNSIQAGYTIGFHKVTNIFNVNWNRATSQTTNFFTNKTDIANGPNGIGIQGTDSSPLNYGLPNIVISNFSGISQQQANFSVTQTISASETLSWMHGKHNLRFGGDYRRVHRDFLGGSNSTGTFYFTGTYTGSALADFLAGNAQETTIDAAAAKTYLRQNVTDFYATDDWRLRSYLTLNYGLRYEYFSPFTEKDEHLAVVSTNPDGGFTQVAEVQAGVETNKLPDSLVYPFRTGFAPRLGAALRLPQHTVVRGGFGLNYTNSQYATFASTMARQPMVKDASFVNEQTNEAATAGALTLANGFSSPDATGNYALDPHYRLPYVMAWNVDVQKTLLWGLMMNAGYNGSRGNRLDITSAPRLTSSSHIFNYEQAAAFSRFNAGTLRVNKRMSKGLGLGANYQYAHSIDNAGSVGGTSTVVAQNWQDLKAEEGNSSFDVRHSVSGNYVYELPFGKDKQWLTTGTAAHVFEGFLISGNFTFATGTPLTPSYQADSTDVARGTAGTLRPDRATANGKFVSITAGGGSQKKWFNTAAFTPPAGTYGTASRNSIPGPGTVSNSMSLSKTVSTGDTRSMEMRATANNVFNTVQYAGVDTNVDSLTFGQVTSTSSMRSFSFSARYRF